ncbi:MAG: beta-propeller domain-containing protein [Pseudomonadota bacterium]|nr:beta-propeller domain-containing protein [Pseudomonadota bacterium]
MKARHREGHRPIPPVAPPWRWLAVLLTVFLLPACDGDSGEAALLMATRTLRFATVDELPAYLRTGQSAEVPWTTGDSIATLAVPGAPQAESAASSGAGYSSVNLIETGVDESDLLISDGRYVYTLAPPGPFAPGPEPVPPNLTVAGTQKVRILNIGSPATELSPLASLDLARVGENLPEPTGLYLTASTSELVVLGAGREDPWRDWHNQGSQAPSETAVWVADVSRPAAPRVTTELRFTGRLLDSRMIDDVLYLVTRYAPDPTAVTGTPEAADGGDPTNLLPKVSVDGRAWRNVSLSGCYVEDTGTARDARMISLTAIDLSDPNHRFESICYAGEALTLYASGKALYLASPDWRTGAPYPADDEAVAFRTRTLIHKFAFEGTDITYRGSGVVAGELADSPREAAYRFSEQGNDLRIVTQAFERPAFIEPLPAQTVSAPAVDDTGPVSPVVLTVLRDTGSGDLERVAMLPNRHRPEAIGLRGERLYGSRFAGDFAYIVTFRVIDPLYVIDLSDPADPFISGSLKVDGFSDYLHPLEGGLMLGIGKHAVPAGDGEFRGAWYQGVKLTLLDVANPRSPAELDQIVIGERGTEASVLVDHRALALRSGKDGVHVAFGVALHDDASALPDPPQPWGHYGFTHHGLYRFEVDVNDRSIRQLSPLLAAPGVDAAYDPVETDRALIVDDAVHYFHAGQFTSGDWGG